MISRRLPLVLFAAGLFASPAPAQRIVSDLLPPQRRDAVVDIARKLTERAAPTPLAADMPNPFNPAGFNDPDPASALPGPARPGQPGVPGAAGGEAPGQPVRPPGDRDILETLAARLTPSGTFVLGGKPMLIIDRNRFEVGTKFIVTFDGQDYELELSAIDRTTFTLRFRGEEITRPIKPVK